MACEPLKWLPNDQLMVGCKAPESSGSGPIMSAILHRQGDSWVMVEDGAFAGDEMFKMQMGEPYHVLPLTHIPRRSTLPLSRYDTSSFLSHGHFGEDPKDPQSGYQLLTWP